MFTLKTKKTRNHLIGLTLASTALILSACGGGGGGGSPSVDTSGVTDTRLKTDLSKGLTQGIAANMGAFSSVLSSASVFDNVPTQSNKNTSLKSQTLFTATEAGNQLTTAVDDSVDDFSDLLNQSTLTNNGNVYTFTPNASQVCADTDSTTLEIANCETIVSDITFVVTVNAVDANNNVTAADGLFNYNTSAFAGVGFTNNSGYYEAKLGGMHTLLTAVNNLAPTADQETLPSAMQGSLRIASTYVNANSGSLTVSIPSAITIGATGDAVVANIAATNKLFKLDADSSTNTMTVEVALGALNVLTNDENDQGASFPVQLALNAITGKAVVSNNGNELTLTGVSADSVTFAVNGTNALNFDLTSFGAALNTSSAQPTLTINQALDLNFDMTNVLSYFDDDADATDETTVNIEAPSGTVLTEVNGDTTKATNGSLHIAVTETGASNMDVTITNSTCLDTSGNSFGEISCP